MVLRERAEQGVVNAGRVAVVCGEESVSARGGRAAVLPGHEEITALCSC